ncbi:PDZ domain-containing protein [Streptomyces longispororuber]|uniref:PDZ domain-containing protein n=1 Tax=Streptomyces longispororuber TaxID=68230 RepID=A0A918ZZR1_9ACTN|nr:PDZ domain-containing protein [Streptomyces longispororuber]GHE80299.1 PDZ domain-containing protein [Streptomyces longispororuber]
MEQTALRPKPMPGHEPGSGRTSTQEPRPPATRRRAKRFSTLLLGLLCALVLLLTGVGLGTVGATVISMSRLAEMQKQAAASGPAPGPQGPDGAAPDGRTPPGKASTSGALTGTDTTDGPAAGGTTATEGTTTTGGRTAAKARPRTQPRTPPRPQPYPRHRTAPAPGTRVTLGVDAVDAPAGSGALLGGVPAPGPGHAAGLERRDVVVAFGGARVRTAAELAREVAAAHPGRNVTLEVRRATGGRRTVTVSPGVTT